MIDATTVPGMARLLLLLEHDSECWCVISDRLAASYLRDASAALHTDEKKGG